MGKSKRTFERWKTLMESSWAFQVFIKYNYELNGMLLANKVAKKLIYPTLKARGATWTDPAHVHFDFGPFKKGTEKIIDLKSWSKSYNIFHNWTNLNGLMAMSANHETYISSVVALALESDPGVLFESPKSIDGAMLLKKGVSEYSFKKDVIISVTKGDWNARISAFRKVFGSVPTALEAKLGELEKIRNLRNKLGHAFGRDINDSRNHEVKHIESMENLSDVKLEKYQNTIWSTSKSIDKYLLKTHIGEFQAVAFYHRIYDSLRKDVHQSDRAIILKKQLGAFGDSSGKEFCKGLVKYYEDI